MILKKELTVFENLDFGKIRTIILDGDVWFVSKDISDILEYSETNAMTKRLDEDELKTYTDDSSGQVRNISIINESGLYNSIIGSRKPEAKRFKKWITSEVLPTIRKNGGYVNNSELFVNTYFPNIEPTAKQFMVFTLDEKLKAEKTLEEQKPLVEFVNHISATKDSIEVGEFAKVIYDNGIKNMGRNNLFKFLRSKKVLQNDNIPYQKYITNGWFEVIEIPVSTMYKDFIQFKSLVTPVGQIRLLDFIKKNI